MLLTITHLKAPWPEGAVVGDVIDLPGVPAWALGKCRPATEADGVVTGSGEALPPAEDGGGQEQTAPARRTKAKG